MNISERIFKILHERNMSQKDFAEQVGIAGSTVSEWKKKGTNPSADKIMDICAVLEVTPEQLLTGEGIDEADTLQQKYLKGYVSQYDLKLIEVFHGMGEAQKKRLLAYMETLKKLEDMEKDI